MPYPGAHAVTTPDKPAVVMAGSGETLTYARLEERSTRLAAHLRGLRLRRGDVVALLTDNRPQASEVYWACQRAGLYVTAVNWHLTPAEATYVVGDCGATVLIASAALGDLARAVLAGTPAVRTALAYAGTVEGFGDHEAALAAADPVPPADQPRGGDLLYSSGTTGRPKGIKPPLPDRQVTEPGVGERLARAGHDDGGRVGRRHRVGAGVRHGGLRGERGPGRGPWSGPRRAEARA